jgi:hypothetical protein
MSTGSVAELRTSLERAFRSGDPRLGRLAAAETSVTFLNRGAPEESVTVLLDRQPPIVAGPDEPAEITIELSSDQAARFARGALSLPNVLMSGNTAHHGPVRKYLAVDPVLRGLLADLHLRSIEI